MPELIDRTGRRYGKLVVLYQVRSGPDYERMRRSCTSAIWLCQCDCGNRKLVRASYLAEGRQKSCGCSNGVRDELGNRYGRLVVKERVKSGADYERIRKYSQSAIWRCDCDCGHEIYVRGSALRRPLKDCPIRSCGCLQEDATSIRAVRNGDPIILVEDELAAERWLRHRSDPLPETFGNQE